MMSSHGPANCITTQPGSRVGSGRPDLWFSISPEALLPGSASSLQRGRQTPQALASETSTYRYFGHRSREGGGRLQGSVKWYIVATVWNAGEAKYTVVAVDST